MRGRRVVLLSDSCRYQPEWRTGFRGIQSEFENLLPIWDHLEYYLSMRGISVKILRECWEQHAIVQDALLTWYHFVRKASWGNPSDVQRDFSSASILPDNGVVFNLKGNQFRLVVRINYDYQTIYIRFVGTHAEYNHIDATKI